MTAITHRDVLESPVDGQIDEHCCGEHAVSHEVEVEPIEDRAHSRPCDHKPQTGFGIEILPEVELGPITHRTAVHAVIRFDSVGYADGNLAAASAAPDGVVWIGRSKWQRRVTRRTLRRHLPPHA